MNEKKLNQKWIKATVLGTIWAASEIVLGSFLHNLRVPFSGNILTAVGIILLVSAAYKWPDTGMFWRAGIICALLKTLSPSAVIFGPMIAIFAEAVLLEIAVYIAGRNLAGFILGAIAAMSWNLFQKVFNFIIFYGYNIVEVYAQLMKYAEKQLGLQFNAVWLPLLILLFLYALFGAFSAIIAFRIGKQTNQFKNSDFEFKQHPGSLEQKKTNINYSIAWLIFNIAIIIAVFVLSRQISFAIWSLIVIVFAITWAIRYKRALKQLARPRLWIFFVLITMVTAIVFSKIQPQKIAFSDAIITGIEMNLRAVILIMGFTVTGTELYNPSLRRFFRKKHINQLSTALEVAFESLPLTLANTPPIKTIAKNPTLFFNHILAFAEFRLAQIQKMTEDKTRAIIISGDIGSGKTETIKSLITDLKNKNIQVNGFYTPRLLENNKTIGYNIFDIRNEKEIAFLRTRSSNHKLPKVGKYYILSDDIFSATKINIPKDGIFVLDEIGKLELQDKGWHEILTRVKNNSECMLLLSLRKEILNQLIKKYELENAVLFDVKKTSPTHLLNELNRLFS